MTEYDEAYAALSAARKYVFAGVLSAERLAAVAKATPGLTANEVASAQRMLRIAEDDLATIDKVLAEMQA